MGGKRVRVTETVQETLYTQHPTSPDQTLGRVGEGPAKEQSRDYSMASAHLVSNAGDSNFLLAARGPTTWESACGGTSISGASGQSYWGGAGGSPRSISAGGSGALARAEEIERGLPRILAANASHSLSGNFSMVVWSADVQVLSPTEEVAYWAGARTNASISASTAAGERREERLLEIEVTEGRLVLAPRGMVRAAAEAFFFETEGDVHMADASGSLSNATTQATTSDDRIHFQGAIKGSLSKTDGANRLLAAQIAVDEGQAEFDGVSLTAARPTIAQPVDHDRNPWALGFVAILPFIFLVGRLYRVNGSTIDDAEWALLANRPRQAYRIARRLRRKDRHDPDLLFLIGASLLKLNRHRRLVSELEPATWALPRHLRRGLAFLLAVSLTVVEDAEGSRIWAREAVEDPALAKELASVIPGLVVPRGTTDHSPAYV